ncbi:MAG: hypothetical protein RLN76_02220 [Phycisphaeraceae bacterium]
MKRPGSIACLAAIYLYAAVNLSHGSFVDLDIIETTFDDLPGHTAYTFRATSNLGLINALEFDVIATDFYQLNPYELNTVFMENNPTLEYLGYNPLHDSQFLFNRNQSSLLVTYWTESDQQMRTQFVVPGSRGGFVSQDVARFVVPDGAAASYVFKAIGPSHGDKISTFTGRFGDPFANIPHIAPIERPKTQIFDPSGSLGLTLNSVQPTPGLPGYSTYILQLTSNGNGIAILEADLKGPVLNQLKLGDALTPLSNLNPLLIADGQHALADTQLLVSESDYSAMNVSFASESEEHLEATILFPHFQRYLGGDIIQVVIPDGQLAVLDLHAFYGESENFTRVIGQIGGDAELVLIPEPTTLTTLLALALLRRRRVAT